TPFDKVELIEEDIHKAHFIYWPDKERAIMEPYENGSPVKTRYYAPGYEKEIDDQNNERDLCYVYGPEGNVTAILETVNDVNNFYYVLTDHLGSITHIIDRDGN